MASILEALREILIRALPTFFLIIFLHLFLKYIFLKPFRAVMHKRYEEGEGAKRQAEAMMARAEQKIADYKAKLDEVRNQIYREQEQERTLFRVEQQGRIEQAREQANQQLTEARHRLELQTAEARAQLREESEALAEKIAASLLKA